MTFNAESEGGSVCEDAYSVCSNVFNQIMNVAGRINVRRKKKNYLYYLCFSIYLVLDKHKSDSSLIRCLCIFDMQYYDIRKKCEGQLCYDFSNMETFLDQKSVKDALGVGNIDFISCSTYVYQAMISDWMRNLEVGIPALLEDGIRVLIYAGEYDLICNWLGKTISPSND